MLFHGARVVRFQLLVLVPFIAAALGGKLLLAKPLGVTGISVSLVIAYAAFVLIPYAIYIRRWMTLGASETQGEGIGNSDHETTSPES